MFPALFDEAEVDGFLVTQPGQQAAHGKGLRVASAGSLGVMGAKGGWSAGCCNPPCVPPLRSDLLRSQPQNGSSEESP